MKKKKAPTWYAAKEKDIVRTGRLDLSNKVLSELDFIGTPKMLKHLDLSFTNITTLSGLKPQLRLESIDVSGSMLASFENFASIIGVRSINMQNTPVSKYPNAILSLTVLFGESLRKVNGKLISNVVRKRAATYPDIARELINTGWIAEYPCPPFDDLVMLHGGVNLPNQSILATPSTIGDGFDSFETVADEILRYEKEMHKEFDIKFYGDCIPTPPEPQNPRHETPTRKLLSSKSFFIHSNSDTFNLTSSPLPDIIEEEY